MSTTKSPPSSSISLLPRKGDRVRIHGLVGAKEHNGKEGIVTNLASVEQLRYGIQLERESRALSVRLANLTICENPKTEELHVLIPCHIHTDRRFVTFMRAAKSVMHQRDDCLELKTDYAVFIGLSGPKTYRTQAFQYLAKVALIHGCRWYLQDDEISAKPQMEHLRSLLLHGSILINPKALLTFLDNDDMCHPLRFHFMMQGYQSLPFERSESCTLAIPCKLLLDPSITPDEGQLDNFVSMDCLQDFDYWKTSSAFASKKVQLATNDTAQDLDAEEYFDFIIPSDILKKFFELNPTKVTSNKFCDLRLFQVLYKLCPLELGDMIPGMWLLAHYKIPMEEKMKAFDRHGQLDTNRLIHAVDQASFSNAEEQSQASAAKDRLLAQKYLGRLSPGQVGMCRGHLESIILSYIGWDEETLQEARREKVIELTRSHGPGFAEELWEECDTTIRALFDAASLKASKGAWKRLPVDML